MMIFKQASLFIRLISWFYDLVLLTALLLVISAICVLLNGGTAIEKNQTLFYFYQALMALVICSYFIGFWVITGQTTGMRAWKLYVLNSQQKPLSFNKACLRFLWGSLTLGLGIFWALFDKNKYPLYEKLSGTYLFKKEHIKSS